MNNNKRIYYLDYVYEFEDGHDDIRLLGVFSSRKKAKEALLKIKNDSSYDKIAKHLIISEDVMETLDWKEGYIIVY